MKVIWLCIILLSFIRKGNNPIAWHLFCWNTSKFNRYKNNVDILFSIQIICSIGDVCNWHWLLYAIVSYKKVSSGSCASNGGQLASSKYECEAAAKALDLSGIMRLDQATPIFPPGCIYRDSDDFLIWNNIMSSSVNCGSDLGMAGVYDCLCTIG